MKVGVYILTFFVLMSMAFAIPQYVTLTINSVRDASGEEVVIKAADGTANDKWWYCVDSDCEMFSGHLQAGWTQTSGPYELTAGAHSAIVRIDGDDGGGGAANDRSDIRLFEQDGSTPRAWGQTKIDYGECPIFGENTQMTALIQCCACVANRLRASNPNLQESYANSDRDATELVLACSDQLAGADYCNSVGHCPYCLANGNWDWGQDYYRGWCACSYYSLGSLSDYGCPICAGLGGTYADMCDNLAVFGAEVETVTGGPADEIGYADIDRCAAGQLEWSFGFVV